MAEPAQTHTLTVMGVEGVPRRLALKLELYSSSAMPCAQTYRTRMYRTHQVTALSSARVVQLLGNALHEVK